MAEKIGELGVEIGADIKKLQKGFDDAEKSAGKFENGIKSLGSSLDKSFLGGIFAGNVLANVFMRLSDQTAQFFKNSISSALQFETANFALQKTIGEGADNLVAQLKEASRGTINELNLIQTANKALALGIEQSKLPELLEVARARAKLMGMDTTEAFDILARGIGQQSSRMLTTLGITLDVDAAYKEYAATIGISVGALSEFEKKQAIVNRLLQESQGIVKELGGDFETNADRLARAKSELDNFTRSLGTFFVEGAGGYLMMNRVTNELNERLAKGGEESQKLADELESAGVKLQKTWQFGKGGFSQIPGLLRNEELQAGMDILEKLKKETDDFNVSRLTAEDIQKRELQALREKQEMDERAIQTATDIAAVQEKLNQARAAGIPDFALILQLQDELDDKLEKVDDRTKKLAASMVLAQKAIRGAAGETYNLAQAVANFNETTGLGDVTPRALEGFFSSLPQAQVKPGSYRKKNVIGRNADDTPIFGDFMMRPGQDPVRFSANDTIVGFQEGSVPRMGGGEPIVVESNLILDGQQIYRATQRVFQEEFLRRSG